MKNPIYLVEVDSSLVHNDNYTYKHFRRGKKYKVYKDGFIDELGELIHVADDNGVKVILRKCFFKEIK